MRQGQPPGSWGAKTHPPPSPRSCRSAPLRAGIWAQRGIGWRELAAANSGVAWLGGRERTRVPVTGTGLRATSSGSPGSATFVASSWGPAGGAGGWAG